MSEPTTAAAEQRPDDLVLVHHPDIEAPAKRVRRRKLPLLTASGWKEGERPADQTGLAAPAEIEPPRRSGRRTPATTSEEQN